MNKKDEIMTHQLNAINLVSGLENLSEPEWRTASGEGKWTLAEIIGHFVPWDEFIMQKRLPYLLLDQDQDLLKGPESQYLNIESALISRNEDLHTTIQKFIATRTALYRLLNDAPDQKWEKTCFIGSHKFSFYEYFKGLAEHDPHHFSQIKKVLTLDQDLV